MTLSTKKLKIWEGFWTVGDVSNNPTWLFIFGDNDVKIGCGGQAIIRHLKNAHGIPTKKYPQSTADSFYNDKEYTQNCNNIKKAFDDLFQKQVQYDKIIFPSNGIGTGLAMLEQKAPRTWGFLLEQLKRLNDV